MWIEPEWIAYLAYCPDWTGLDPTLAGLGLNWISENESISYSVTLVQRLKPYFIISI